MPGLKCIAQIFGECLTQLRAQASRTFLLLRGLSTLRLGAGLSGVVLTFEGKKASSEGEGDVLALMVSGGAWSKGSCKLVCERTSYSPFLVCGDILTHTRKVFV